MRWREVAGYEGLYEVSDSGIVRSIDHYCNGIHVPSKELKPNLKQRYLKVKLYKNGKPKSAQIHRLVAAAYIPNPDKKPQVNHIDGNKMNNCATNLEWCTQAENNRHAIDNGLTNPLRMVEATRKSVLQLDMDGNIIKEWESLSDAARELGLQVSNISHCCKGRIKSTGGYRWKIVSER